MGITNMEFEKGIQFLYQKTNNIVFVTDGKNGSYAYDGSLHFQPSIPIIIKNTIGAGDSHAGICLKGLYENKTVDSILKEANEYASKVLSEK